ncbi:MAG: hypothetical protein WCI74_03170, partial [Actinomycetes bacterium]
MIGSPGSLKRTRSYAKPGVVIGAALALVTVGAVSPAFATGTTLFDQSFQNSTLTGSSPVVKPTVPGGTNLACLTASSNTSLTPVPGCQSPAIDANGSGTLRLTRATTTQVGGVLSSTSIPASSGIDIQFNSYQYGGSGADGIGFVLGAVDPHTQVPPASTGQPGGALG